MYKSKRAIRLRHAIRTLILLPGATFWITGCAPSAAPPAKTSATSPQAQGGQTGQGGESTSQDPGASPSEAGTAGQATQPYLLTATVRDLMDGIIDPSADALWDSVAYIATSKGVEDRQPRTPEEWKAVRNSAITLIEAANLLSMPGRHVVAARLPGDPPEVPAPGELTHDDMQQRINSTHEAFVSFAKNLQNAGLKALAAIDAKNAQGLMDAGGTIDEACEACHVTYWYPNQTVPVPGS